MMIGARAVTEYINSRPFVHRLHAELYQGLTNIGCYC
jgi:hypothetical protein